MPVPAFGGPRLPGLDQNAPARRYEPEPGMPMADAKPLAGHGGDRFDEFQQDDNVILKEQGNSAAYLAGRLPHIFSFLKT